MDDFYCTQILSGKTEVDILFETERILAYWHTNPYWEAHVVIIVKEHVESLVTYAGTAEAHADFFAALQRVVRQLTEQYGGCRVCSNVGNYQTTKHLHWYVHAGKRLRTEAGKPIA